MHGETEAGVGIPWPSTVFCGTPFLEMSVDHFTLGQETFCVGQRKEGAFALLRQQEQRS